ncbi:MAG: electron transfer flavoprotein subunit beta, partial [Methanobacteriota archaeon]
MPLNIVVCLKQIPNPDLQFQIAPDGKDIKRDALNYKLNGADEYALEEAVRLKEKSGGRVIALTAGPKRTEQMLREALAKGADEVTRIAFDEAAAYDVGKVARLLAAAIRTLPHDLVLTGVQSDDLVNSATGGLIAGILGLAHASVVTRVESKDGRLE